MKKKLFLTTFLLAFAFISRAQITGSDTVCAGYIYTYNATIAGADSFAWSLPVGWYILTGEGTSQVQVLCNQNVGQICVSGYDTAGIYITQYCNQIAWGGGGGWDVQMNQVTFCQCPIFTISVIPNGSGTGCGSCGSGMQSPNLRFAIYDNPWPIGMFITFADGISPIGSTFTNTTYYVYQVDLTFGINPAILIEGGGCSSVINNTFFIPACMPQLMNIYANPDPVCIGDTVTLQYDGMLGQFPFFDWQITMGSVIFVSPDNMSSIQCVITAQGPVTITVQADDGTGCFFWGQINVNSQLCNLPPVASFSATNNPICPGTCTGFTNLSTNGVSYEWSFNGATPSTSTSLNPSNICYNTPGSYDVSLIATNANGNDTLIQSNFITVLPYPSSQSIIQSGDTLISNTGFTSYQWYYNGTIITGATDYYYVATQNGDYNVISVDANGCEVEAVMFSVVTGTGIEVSDLRVEVYPNPVSEKLEIRSWKIQAAAKISIYNTLGALIAQSEITNQKSEFSMDVTEFANGMYWLEVSVGEKSFRSKFIKQ